MPTVFGILPLFFSALKKKYLKIDLIIMDIKGEIDKNTVIVGF